MCRVYSIVCWKHAWGKSTLAAACELQRPHLTVHWVLQKYPCLYAYMMHVAQAIIPDDRIKCNQSSVTIPEKVDKDNILLRKIMFSDEATFDISGKVNTQNIWSGDQNNLTLQCSILHTAPKLTCGVASCTIICPNPLSLPKQLQHPAITWICWKTLSIHS